MNESRVTVVIPVHNGARFLAEAVRSTVDQSTPPEAVWVVDDGSTDATAEIAAELARRHQAVRVLGLEKNCGPATARNAGLDRAESELVTFLDADDRMAPGRLELQIGYLGEHPEADVVLGKEEITVEPGTEPPPWLVARRGREPGVYPMSLMARASAFERAGKFDESLQLGDDIDWLLRADAAGVSIALSDRVLVQRRIHGDNLTYRDADLRDALSRVTLRAARARVAARRNAGK